MKNTLLVVLSLVWLVNPVMGHPPSNVTASYDPASQVLTVVIFHNTVAPAAHFVKKASLTVNGKEFLAQSFGSQYDKQRQVVMAVIPGLKTGLSFIVKADCNLWGTLEKELRVEVGGK